MKIIKILFSRAIVTLLAIVLQVVIFFTVLYAFNAYFAAFQILSAIIGLAVFLYVINKKECPEFKIPWLVIMLLLPLFGFIIYIMFARPRIKKSSRELIDRVTEKTSEFLDRPDEAEVRDFLGKYAGVEKYVENNSHVAGSFNNRVTYYSTGEDFFVALLEELEKAEKFIFMEYFIIEPGKMWNSVYDVLKRKAASGVEVRVLYDDMGSLGKVGRNYFKRMRDDGINCCKFNKLLPIVSGIYNNRDHRKITVIDGKTGFTGGINLADEYINEVEKFGHWKDTAIKIEGRAVKNLTAMFVQVFDVTAGEISENYARYFETDLVDFPDEGFVCPFGDGPKPYYSEQVGENTFVNIISAAERYVYITTPYLIIDHNMETALRNAAMRGVDVRIITPHIPDKKIVFNMTRSNYPYLLEAGVKIFEYTPGFIHAKTLVADGEIAFVGTINLDYRSLVHHYECGALMFRSPCVEDIKTDFDKTLSVCEEITKDNFKMNKAAAFVNSVLNIFSPLF